LGAQDNFTDELLVWAYNRQRECDPRNRPYYLDCLAGLAEGRNSGELQTRQAMAESAGELRLSEIEAAYKFFALDPKMEHTEDTIIGTYKSRIENAPLQRDEARKCLNTIGEAKDSEKIKAVANDKTMTLKEAFEFLDLTEDVDNDTIQAAAVGLVGFFNEFLHLCVVSIS
jgi:ubiquitin carboxyl-terminal hydrolase 25